MKHISPLKIYHAEPLEGTLSFISTSTAYQYSSLSNCDLILHHQLCEDAKTIKSLLRQLSLAYKTKLKKVLVFIMLDDEQDYGNFDNLILVRASARASKLRYNEIILPYIWQNSEIPFPVSPITPLPVVGFCGLLSKHRRKLINVFQKSTLITVQFLIRAKFWGGRPHDKSLVADFFDNIRDSQYILSNRGAGNFSMRFYQVLSCGRIPVLVNTDMALPFSSKIDWKDLVVFEKDEASCLRSTIEIHQTGNTQNRQLKCSQVYRDFLAPHIYFIRLIEEIKKRSLLEFKDVLLKKSSLMHRLLAALSK